MTFVIYHNPTCGTSRNALALLRHAGVEPHVIDYQLCPPNRELLRQMIAASGMPVRDVLRVKGTPYEALGLDNPALSDELLLEAMDDHPILINRPLVVSDRGVKLCRPADLVLDLLPDRSMADFHKEAGEQVLRDVAVTGDDVGLQAALDGEQLPTADLAEKNRRFFRYSTLSGAVKGYGGLELYGEEVLVRSIVVLPEGRSHGVGKSILALLARRAFDLGARRLWLLTLSADRYFERRGLITVARQDTPEVILATRQAKSMCPSNAIIMSKQIRL